MPFVVIQLFYHPLLTCTCICVHGLFVIKYIIKCSKFWYLIFSSGVPLMYFAHGRNNPPEPQLVVSWPNFSEIILIRADGSNFWMFKAVETPMMPAPSTAMLYIFYTVEMNSAAGKNVLITCTIGLYYFFLGFIMVFNVYINYAHFHDKQCAM